MGHVLRPRRTLLLPFTGVNPEHHKRRPFWNQSAATFRKHTVLSDIFPRSFQFVRFIAGSKRQSTCLPLGRAARLKAHGGSHCRHSICSPCQCPLLLWRRHSAKYRRVYFMWTSALLFGRLRARKQAPVHDEQHLGHSVAAAQRLGSRYWVCKRPWPPRSHPDPVQSSEDCL